MFDWFTGFFATKEKVDWKTIYQGPNDLPSLNEMIESHVEMLNKQEEGKFTQTTD